MNAPTSLQDWRKSKALTQQDLADAVGIHVQYLSAIECGRRRPGMALATKIRDYTGGVVSLDALAAASSAAERKAA